MVHAATTVVGTVATGPLIASKEPGTLLSAIYSRMWASMGTIGTARIPFRIASPGLTDASRAEAFITEQKYPFSQQYKHLLQKEQISHEVNLF